MTAYLHPRASTTTSSFASKLDSHHWLHKPYDARRTWRQICLDRRQILPSYICSTPRVGGVFYTPSINNDDEVDKGFVNGTEMRRHDIPCTWEVGNAQGDSMIGGRSEHQEVTSLTAYISFRSDNSVTIERAMTRSRPQIQHTAAKRGPEILPPSSNDTSTVSIRMLHAPTIASSSIILPHFPRP